MSTLLGPVTDGDLRRWQLQRYRLLGDILEHGHKQDLPPLAWRVTPDILIGDATQIDMDERRVAFDAWVASLELDRLDDVSHSDGLVQLCAIGVNLWNRRTKIRVVAHILNDLP